ncbi:unnamed protein product [Echinostoma caproni]|uniref:DUF4537 domain-containing protein n=1 Tax=Echinostoma caproni TaxID=27848 RepID=A0A183ATP9_9TREM|nr:unnamed protein product [Echinostoma caproni]
MGTSRSRTLSPVSIRSPDPSVAELYGVKSHTLSPEGSQRDLLSDSVDLGSVQSKTTPSVGGVWAWDTRFVEHQRSESPWLPSGHLSDLYIQDHLCYRCGLVQKCVTNDASVVRFRHNGLLSEVPNQLTLPIVDMLHTQTLNDGDTVLVRVKNVNESCECWVPARVQGGFLGSPDPRYPLRHRYQLRLFSGAKEEEE